MVEMSFQIFDLGETITCLGSAQGDIKKIIGSFPCALDLNPEEKRFPNKPDWSIIPLEQKYGIGWFTDEHFSDFRDVSRRLESEGHDPKVQTVLTHLALEICPICDILSSIGPNTKLPKRIYASSQLSAWRDDHGGAYIPYIAVPAKGRGISASRVVSHFDHEDGFLLIRN